MGQLKKFVSRKLLVMVGTPVLTMALLTVNTKLGSPWTSEQVAEIVQWLIGLAGTYLLSQGAVDVMEKKARVEPDADNA